MIVECSECPDRKGDRACVFIIHEAYGSSMEPIRCPLKPRFHEAVWRPVLVTPRAQCRVKKPGRRTATRLATRRKVQGKVYNYKLVGNNGGTLGYAILEKGCFRFEVEVCPLQNFTSDTLRKIATVLDGFNAAKSEERDVQTN